MNSRRFRPWLLALLLGALLGPISRANFSEEVKRYELHEGATIPEFGIFNLSGSQANMAFTSNNNLAADARGVPGDGSFLLWALVNGRSAGEFNHGIFFYWDLERLPPTLDVRRAWFEFHTTNNGPYIAGADEKLAIRRINDPEGRGLWANAYYDPVDEAWKGASWRYMRRDSRLFYVGEPWSNLPSTAQYGHPGDLSSVLEAVTSDTARISFPATRGKAVSTDATTDVLKVIRGWAPSRGFYLDPETLINRNYSASYPNRMLQVGVLGHWNSDPAKRPRLVIEAVPPRNYAACWTNYE